ncbi:hypothetical protein L1987_78105 [Smallanthus sonchifolius]|uniref:Uncharacterized protein n=1 Tax=Smallanthus sonchifolius TaxID=185202 RepID=A0ACB8ZBH1_9ASTR|nr:hypothetical protein L1987_78105 [Smallanthus sonchifolius]
MPVKPFTASGDTSSIIPYSPEASTPTVYTLHHGRNPPITPRLSISCSRGNSLRVTVFRSPEATYSNGDESGGRVVDLKLSGEDVDSEINDTARWRRIAYGLVSPFAHLQIKKNSKALLSELWHSAPYDGECKEINALLGSKKSCPTSLIEEPRTVLKNVEEPSSLKAAWELLGIFYADKQSHPWIPEQLVYWLSDYDTLFSGQVPSVHLRLVEFQAELINIQSVENEPRYWQAVSSALEVDRLDIVVKLLCLHGSYQLNQLGTRENELVEAVAVLVSKMPRMCAGLTSGNLGNTRNLSSATYHWVELYIAHFLYISSPLLRV